MESAFEHQNYSNHKYFQADADEFTPKVETGENGKIQDLEKMKGRHSEITNSVLQKTVWKNKLVNQYRCSESSFKVAQKTGIIVL